MLTHINNDEPMGYVYVNESTSTNNAVTNITESGSAGTDSLFYVTFDTNLQDFDVENRNHRYYDATNIMDCIKSERIQSLLNSNGWFGEFDHPDAELNGQALSPKRLQNVPPDRRAFKIMQPHLVGNILKAKIQSAQGVVGEGFGKEVLAGWIPQFSVRAIASMANRHGKPYVNVRRLITYDAPWFPSHRCAHATSAPIVHARSFGSYVRESADVEIPLKDILVKVGNEDVNVNMICEAFDLTMDDIQGISKDRKHAIIRDGSNTIYAGISPDTVKRINKFFDSF